MDEAHERNINTDILFGIVKKAQASRCKKEQISLKVRFFIFILSPSLAQRICCIAHFHPRKHSILIFLFIMFQVVVMSATMDVDHFSRYFDKAPVIYIEGRQHPINIYYTKNPQQGKMFSVLCTIRQINEDEDPG